MLRIAPAAPLRHGAHRRHRGLLLGLRGRTGLTRPGGPGRRALRAESHGAGALLHLGEPLRVTREGGPGRARAAAA